VASPCHFGCTFRVKEGSTRSESGRKGVARLYGLMQGKMKMLEKIVRKQVPGLAHFFHVLKLRECGVAPDVLAVAKGSSCTLYHGWSGEGSQEGRGNGFKCIEDVSRSSYSRSRSGNNFRLIDDLTINHYLGQGEVKKKFKQESKDSKVRKRWNRIWIFLEEPELYSQ